MIPTRGPRRLTGFIVSLTAGTACLFVLATLPACLQTDAGTGISASTNASNSTSTSATIPSGPLSAKIYFQIPNNPAPASATNPWSFYTPPAGGTTAAIGSGLPVQQYYQTALSATSPVVLSNTPGTSSWPQWITQAEIGISGASNASSPNANCARFAALGETAMIGGINYAAPSYNYRVSEFDCAGTLQGQGAGTDGVYVRLQFDRTGNYLGTTENVMAVLEYTTGSIHTSPTDPSTCFSIGGIFQPWITACSDMNWNTYLTNSSIAAPNPFLMLVPPLNGTGMTSSAQIQARQIFLPLGVNPSLTTLQISRVNSLTGAEGVCTVTSSPYCLGMVLYTLSLYRM